jgi:gliding motility associated protien GldN
MKKLILIMISAFAFNVNAQDNLDEADRKLDGGYEEVTLKEREIVAYDHLREADIKWKKRIWRVIDFKEKINLPFAHPQKGIVKILHDAAKSGEIQVFTLSDKGETFQEPMKAQDVAQIGVRNDTITRVNFETGLEERVPAVSDFDPAKVTKMRIKEEWYFDIETSTMVTRILGICMVTDKVSEQGDYVGDQPMYWIYYPDVRKILAQNQVFNVQNDANTTSWEDVMEMRYFSSYIYKETNAFERRIQEYATGNDLLYESDRIHNMIRDKESDYWEY